MLFPVPIKASLFSVSTLPQIAFISGFHFISLVITISTKLIPNLVVLSSYQFSPNTTFLIVPEIPTSTIIIEFIAI